MAVIAATLIAEVRAIREALAAAFQADGRVELSHSSADADDPVAAARRSTADVVLFDLPFAKGLAAARSLTVDPEGPEIKIVVFGVADDEEEIAAWAQTGILGCVGDGASLDELIGGVVLAARGEAFWSPSIAKALFRRVEAIRKSQSSTESAEVSKLTTREIEILRLVAIGCSNKQIANELTLEVSTVKTHLHSIFAKLDIHHRSDVAEWLRVRDV